MIGLEGNLLFGKFWKAILNFGCVNDLNNEFFCNKQHVEMFQALFCPFLHPFIQVAFVLHDGQTNKNRAKIAAQNLQVGGGEMLGWMRMELRRKFSSLVVPIWNIFIVHVILSIRFISPSKGLTFKTNWNHHLVLVAWMNLQCWHLVVTGL